MNTVKYYGPGGVKEMVKVVTLPDSLSIEGRGFFTVLAKSAITGFSEKIKTFGTSKIVLLNGSNQHIFVGSKSQMETMVNWYRLGLIK